MMHNRVRIVLPWDVMTREEIIARLRENEAELPSGGVAHAALFGSRARGDAHPDSDTNILIEIDPEARSGSGNMSGSSDTSLACLRVRWMSWTERR